MSQKPKRKWDTSKRDAVTSLALDRLEQGTKNLNPEEWGRWLKAQQTFHTYSLNNAWLILMQRPTASLVAGYHTWPKVNRHVVKGASGIYVRVPFRAKKDPLDPPGTEGPVVGFGWGCVFDISDTDGEPLPLAQAELVQGGTHEILEALEKIAVDMGYTIGSRVFDENDGQKVHGYVSYTRKEIAVDRANPLGHQIKTMVHELAHVLTRAMKMDKEKDEIVAESVAYCVCDVVEVQNQDYSFHYLASWSKESNFGDEVKEAAKVIRAVTDRVLDALGIEVPNLFEEKADDES